jgi:hypothetical protein
LFPRAALPHDKLPGWEGEIYKPEFIVVVRCRTTLLPCCPTPAAAPRAAAGSYGSAHRLPDRPLSGCRPAAQDNKTKEDFHPDTSQWCDAPRGRRAGKRMQRLPCAGKQRSAAAGPIRACPGALGRHRRLHAGAGAPYPHPPTPHPAQD